MHLTPYTLQLIAYALQGVRCMGFVHPTALLPKFVVTCLVNLRKTHTPYALHPTPYALHPTALLRKFVVKCLVNYILNHTYTSHTKPYTLRPTPYITPRDGAL